MEDPDNLFLNTYSRIPIEISSGEGVHLISKDGKRYLDFFSGLGVSALGHSHPRIVEAVTRQLSKHTHISNYFITDIQIQFAELLTKHSGMQKVFLCNSGTESIEAAIKLIRKAKPGKRIYSLSNSFHGRTFGAMSLALKEDYINNYSPLLQNFDQIKFDDINDLKNKVDEQTAAVFVELIQGEGGINILSQEFVKTMMELRDNFNFILVADEVQSGIGRTGKGFSFEHYKIIPDLLVLAKAIGGGLPLGALLASQNYSNVFSPGNHGSTFGGNPVSCAAGVVVLKEVFETDMLQEIEKLGNYFIDELQNLKRMYPDRINEVRGKGFMIGIELINDAKIIVEKMREKLVLVNLTNKNVVRILPPLISNKKDIDFCLFNLHETLKEI